MTWAILGVAAASYAAFWAWYVGFGRRISPAETQQVMQCLAGEGWTPAQRENLRRFLENDDGRDFVMVNALHFKTPRREARASFAKYADAFRGELFKRAGHPLLMATAAAANLENLHCEAADDWTAAAVVRYRSRRDFARIVMAFAGSEHHAHKLAALEKTFAFPAAPWFVLGGPRLVVALVLALAAAVAHAAVA